MSDPTVTDPPATDPPAEDPPATDPPAEDPPATDPPAEDPPTTDPPAEDPPATDPPAEDPPTTDQPATDPPAEDPPATDPPTEDPPTTDPPATDPPAEDPPATDPPATDPPAEDPPTTDPTDPPAEDPPADEDIPNDPSVVIKTDPVDRKDPPAPPGPVFVDDTIPPELYIPRLNKYITKYGVNYQWEPATQGLRITGVKDWDLLKLQIDTTFQGTQTWSANLITYDPISYDNYISIKSALDVYVNLPPPSIFGDNFHTAFVNGSVNISSGTSYVSAPTLNMQIDKPGIYVVHWYVEVLIPEGAVEVLVLANGASRLSNTTYGQSTDVNDWRTVSGFAVERFAAGNAGVKLAYKYVDVNGTSIVPTRSSTARNAKLMVYQVGRGDSF